MTYECDWQCVPHAVEPLCWVHNPAARPADYPLATHVDGSRTFGTDRGAPLAHGWFVLPLDEI